MVGHNNNNWATVGEAIAQLLRCCPRIGVYRFEFAAEEPLVLPPFPGSAWRGLVGHGLRRTVCVTRQPGCDGCLLVGSCVYSTIFESPPPDASAGERYNAVPHPFALAVESAEDPVSLAEGDRLGFGITLFGAANSALPYFAHAMNQVGDRGIGRGHGRFAFRRLLQHGGLSGGWQQIYSADGPLRRLPELETAPLLHEDPPPAVTVRLLTPLRLKRRGRLVGPGEFQIDDMLRQLFWRVSDLTRFYGSSHTPPRWDDLETAVVDLAMEPSGLRWRDWSRYSSRQDTLMQMGGLVGDLLLSGEGLRVLWPLLRLGEWVQVGKATSMGLGRYRLDRPASLRVAAESGQR